MDEIILQEHPVRVDLRKLPDGVEMIVEAGDDDGDDDRGGGRLPTMKETLDKWHRDQLEIYEEEDEEEEEESDKGSFGGSFMGMPKDEPHDDDDEAFVTPPQSNKSSDEFRLELPKLESDKEKLINELQSKKAEVQKVELYNQVLTLDLQNLRKEIDLMRDMENHRREDYEYLEQQYEEQKKKIEDLGLGKRQLETRIQELKQEHKTEVY